MYGSSKGGWRGCNTLGRWLFILLDLLRNKPFSNAYLESQSSLGHNIILATSGEPPRNLRTGLSSIGSVSGSGRDSMHQVYPRLYGETCFDPKRKLLFRYPLKFHSHALLPLFLVSARAVQCVSARAHPVR
ncbi:hypothetical protein NDU88_005296 [Pleurodeles waltl]|uniref:Uncharacterized protein n=1 Tax=Pleurodeles waltl TaxID=8319 RepID=A0AAV7TAA6_PLEWA|nr:hypothetical protein NDU88_005296 [Pleurodeles waltl]